MNDEQKAEQGRKALDTAREEQESVANMISGYDLRLKNRSEKAKAAANTAMQLTMDCGAMESRIRLLSEMEKEYEGFSKAVRFVMQAAEKHTLRGICGPVAGLLQVDDRYTVAIEVALGAGMQNIIVEREEDAKAAISYLKQRDAGRATFLPRSAMRGDELRERVQDEYGFVGIASALVQYDARYDGIFKNLLGRTVVVEDLDCGIAMARKFGSRFRIVTLDGQVMNRGGSMTGGSVSRSAGILSRANELSRLTEQLAALKVKQAEADHTQEECERELKAAQYELEVAEGQKRQAEDAVLKLETEQKQYQMNGRKADNRAASEEAEQKLAA